MGNNCCKNNFEQHEIETFNDKYNKLSKKI